MRSSLTRISIALALAAATSPLAAQQSDSVSFASRRSGEPRSARAIEKERRKLDFVPAARFDEARRRAARSQSQGAPVHVAADRSTGYTLAVRSDTSEVEQHARWDDLVIVRSGTGVVSFGERTEGRRMIAAGEYRGGRLVGAYELSVAPGDMIRIPAGVPHAFWPAAGSVMEYVVVKVRRGELPLVPK